MNNFFKILSVFVICVVVASCSKSSSTDPVALRDYATQYAADHTAIETYVNTHYMTVNPTNFDVTFTKIPEGGTQQSIRTQTQYPLKDTTIVRDGFNYVISFIKFREGTNKRPTQVDSVNVAYRGINIADATTGGEDAFDQAITPLWFKLPEVITGWSTIIPSFRTGTYTPGTGGSGTTFDNFGAGVMFLPSRFGYYSNGAGNIPSYSPIIFSFKLYELRYRDQDGDGVLSKDERKLDPLVNPLIRWKENPSDNLYKLDNTGAFVTDVPFLDTDGDGYANMYDIDDDGDHVLTRVEIKNPLGGLYLYNMIPDCGGFTTDPNRVRKHIDPACH